MLDQKKLIEEGSWRNPIVFDACRYDYFEEIYPDYLEGDLIKAHNRGISWTFDWFNEMFGGEYDAVLYSAAPFAIREKWSERGWTYTDHFVDVIGHQDIDFNHKKGSSPPELINEAVRRHNWSGRRVIRILQPHPPFLDTPLEELTKGKGKIQRTQRMIDEGRLTFGELRDAYEKNVRIAFEGVVDLIPDLDGDVVITSDHGECLGRCGQFYHARGFEKHDHLVEVPWFNVEDTVEQ